MENPQNQTKTTEQPKIDNPNYFPVSINSQMGMNQNPISYLGNACRSSELPQDEQTKNNIFIQKRNRMEEKNDENNLDMDINADIINNATEMNDCNSDINLKPLLSGKNNNNNHEQFICKKMSVDLDDDINNMNIQKKNMNGCNCKNSGCLKRYCECFSRMKYCDINCQCKNCFNNMKYEKERNEAIRIYLTKSPVSFKKINMDLNNITCNCKKSNCLKNYCECFQFGLKCTYSCNCVDCKNRNLFEKKLFFVENNCDNKKTSSQSNDNNIINIAKNNISNNLIKLQEEETNNNNKILDNNNNNIDNRNKINNPQFIVNKKENNNNLINNNINQGKMKNRTRFLSFDDDMSQISQWNNLNLKKIEISNKKLIIDNYNINQPDDVGSAYQGLQPNNYTNNFLNNNFNINNNMIITRKNSAFSAMIK